MEFDALVQCKGNALEHRQQMSFVIGIFQAFQIVSQWTAEFVAELG